MGCVNPHRNVTVPKGPYYTAENEQWEVDHVLNGDVISCTVAVKESRAMGLPAVNPATIDLQLSAVVILLMALVLLLSYLTTGGKDWD